MEIMCNIFPIAMVEYELVNMDFLRHLYTIIATYVTYVHETFMIDYQKIYVYALMGMHNYAIIYDMEQWIV